MAEKMEILVEKQRRGARSNQKLKIQVIIHAHAPV